VALVLGAIWAALDERPGWVLGLGTAAALLRPEVWPFLALWSYFASKDQPRLRAAAIVAALLIPVAWFVPDILGAGTPLEGGETARAGGIEPLDGLAVLGRAIVAPLAAAWIGLALLLWRERDKLDPPLKIVLAGATAWTLLVAVMAIAGFAGLPRFLAPATAVIAVLGGVGIARTAATESRTLVTVTVLLAIAGFAWRAAQIPGDLDVVDRQTTSIEDLFDLVDKTGPIILLSCHNKVSITQVRQQTALAWKLEEPISATPIWRHPKHGVVLSTKPLPNGQLIATAGTWRATSLPCPSQHVRTGRR
jgi:hypothetical protein